jgi:beta-glucanase (GH16 family)
MNKKYIFCIFFILLPTSLILCQPIKPGFVCVLNEEFNGNSLDESYWRIAHGLVRGGCDGVKGYYRPQNIEVSNGTLKIHTKKEKFTERFITWLPDNTKLDCHGRIDPNGEFTNLMEWDYSTGEIFTHQRFKYGYFEIRCRLAKGAGLNSAFWMYGPGPQGGTDEIDFFEIFGNRDNQLHTDIHCNTTACDVGGWVNLGTEQYIFSEYHTYSGYWDEDQIIFFYDGERIEKYYKDFGYNQYLIIGIGMGGGFAGNIDDSALPSRMEVDYVRVYKKLSQENVLINDFNNWTYCNIFTGDNITISNGENIINVDGTDENNKYGNYLECYATESIKIQSNFHAKYGSHFKAKIVDDSEATQDLDLLNETLLKSSNSKNNNVTNHDMLRKDNDKIIIYPNPVNDYIKIQIGIQNDKIYQGRILNTLGKTVKTFTINQFDSKIDINYLPSGLYLLEINLTDNIYSYKFIKK